MALRDITRSAVLQALDEWDTTGGEAFLSKYGYRPSRSYVLSHAGREYASKAIVGVAHGFLGSGNRTLKFDEFSGGERQVARILRTLGFEVSITNLAGPRRLKDGRVNRHRRDSREWLVGYFLARCGTRDARTGRIRPPAALGASTRNAALDLFFEALAQGRSPDRFRNSLKNARDAFDAHVPSSGRVGWRADDAERTPQPLSSVALEIFESWRSRTDEELAEQVLAILDVSAAPRIQAVRWRTGEEVKFKVDERVPRGRQIAADDEFNRTSLRRARRRAEDAKLVGDRGEEVVAAYLAALPNIVSESIDRLAPRGLTPGYDIRCMSADGRTLAVEVKATALRSMTSFELTENERCTAIDGAEDFDEYLVYLVTDALGPAPVVHRIDGFGDLLTERTLSVTPTRWLVSGFETVEPAMELGDGARR